MVMVTRNIACRGVGGSEGAAKAPGYSPGTLCQPPGAAVWVTVYTRLLEPLE